MAEKLPRQTTIMKINYSLNRKVCGLKPATILIQDRYGLLGKENYGSK